ncbi:MAG: murein biosynthesis integral membrane protein MurJ [Bdellovibrionales bacterium]|nr:murein biosynthesis integral membrane protein MurJ [Bdellovibrionales bacterium]
MDQIIPWWLGGNGFASVPGKIEMTIQMAQIMVGFLFFVTLFANFMALLNGVKKFALTGFAPIGLNICIISGLYFYKDSPHLAEASAASVLFGGALQAFILLPLIIKSGLTPQFKITNVAHPLVLKVLRKFLPTFFGVGVLQVLAMVNVYFASQLESGALTYIYIGDRLLELPLSLIAVSIGTTLLPTLSEYWSRNEKTLFKECLEKHFKLFYFLAIPAAFGLWFVGADIIQILFVRGEFTPQEVPIVASILQVYCLTLICAGSLKIFNQSFYAAQDTLTPAIISCFGLVIHLFMAPQLMKSMGLQGLVLSTALITLLNVTVSITLLSRRIGSLSWLKIFPHFLKCFVAASFMGGYLYFLSTISWQQGRFFFDFPLLLVLIGIGGGIYFLVATAFKVDEMNQLLRRFRKKA